MGAALLFTCLACGSRGPRAVTRQQNFILENGDLSLEIDPSDGARVVSFALAGHNLLASRDESSEAYGSSFWPSPQSDWGWPPPAAFDKRAWRAHVEGEALVLQSATDPKLLLSASERVSAEPGRAAFRFEFTLHNDGGAPRKAAPWQNSRVRPRGLTFFPSNGPMHSDAQHDVAPQNGVIWFQHDPSARSQGEKFFADGSEGFIAHLDGDMLFVKTFPDLPKSALAPKEAEIELYADGAGNFVEVEQQGAYVELGAHASSSWVVKWAVARVPQSVHRVAGDAGLISFARSIAARIR